MFKYLEQFATVQALKSFDDFQRGEYYDVFLSERIAHLVANDYLRLVRKWQNPDTQFE